MLQTQEHSEIEEATWQAWLKKNKAQDRFRYERRLRVLSLVAVFIAVGTLLWAAFAR
jgi:hypothetical protein